MNNVKPIEKRPEKARKGRPSVHFLLQARRLCPGSGWWPEAAKRSHTLRRQIDCTMLSLKAKPALKESRFSC